jgi:outer membrane protein OmpA-like peptidoglycan-associated protein
VLAIPLTIHLQRNRQDRDLEQTILVALRSAKPIGLAGISVEVDRGAVNLTGRTFNDLQRTRAEGIAKVAAPDAAIENRITTDTTPSLAILTEVRAREIATALNRMQGVFLDTRFANGELLVTGWVPDEQLREKIDGTFDELPGVQAYKNTAALGEPDLPARLHFDLGSILIKPADQKQLSVVQEYLLRFPSAGILVIGHSDLTGREEINRRLATDRANAARRALAALGIALTRIQTQGSPEPPPGSNGKGADSDSRCVRFTLVHQEGPLLP